MTSRRSRRILIASALTLLTSAFLLGLITLTRWRGQEALQSDTHAAVAQAADQLLRSLRSRRGTLTFIRDTLNRQSDLTLPQLKAMGASAVQHTRHLIGTGLIRAAQAPVWWSGPEGASAEERSHLNRAMVRRITLRGVWRVPSTFVTATDARRSYLIMLEPLRSAAYPQSAILGVFELQPLLRDFFSSSLLQRYPVRLLEGDTSLYASGEWRPSTPERRWIVVQQPIQVDAARWTLQMQPGTTRVAQALSWSWLLVVGLSLIAGLGVMVIVWILAARTWILQRAVARRTAALRRTSVRLRQMAVTDELTGLHNRRFFLERWEWECERAKRYQRPLACLMIDVNEFKQVNDRLGHLAGDLVLKQVAQELRSITRQSDILARFGGDEFIVALPETGLTQAAAVADKLRQVRIPVPHHGPDRATLTVSLSVGLSRIEQSNETPQQVLEAADQSLYAYKRRVQSLATPA